jgi:hypothetical protein
MSILRNNLRAQVLSVSELFASADAAREFQILVPHVFAPTEMFCKWFDDAYLPGNAEFISAFSSVELGVIKTLSASLEKLSIEAGDPPPSIERLVKLPSWSEVELNARTLLSMLNA